MKQSENSKDKKKYFAMMLLCFLYGGFTIVLFLMQVYTALWLNKSFSSTLIPEPMDANRFVGAGSGRGEFMRGMRVEPLRELTSPFSIIFLSGGLVAIFAGIAIWRLMRDKELKVAKQEAQDIFLLPEEKKVIDSLKGAGYSSTQKKLSSDSGLTRVQVHRTLKKLEAKGLLEKHDFGMTNKIILKKEIFE